jgi:hypothetical protein
MGTDAAKELKGPREQNARLKRMLADTELEKDAWGRADDQPVLACSEGHFGSPRSRKAGLGKIAPAGRTGAPRG